MSTTKLTVMYTTATKRLTPAIAGTSTLTAAWNAYWPIPGQEKIFSTSTAPVSTFAKTSPSTRSEEHTSELQSQSNLVCRLLLEKKKNNKGKSQSRQRRIDEP